MTNVLRVKYFATSEVSFLSQSSKYRIKFWIRGMIRMFCSRRATLPYVFVRDAKQVFPWQLHFSRKTDCTEVEY